MISLTSRCRHRISLDLGRLGETKLSKKPKKFRGLLLLTWTAFGRKCTLSTPTTISALFGRRGFLTRSIEYCHRIIQKILPLIPPGPPTHPHHPPHPHTTSLCARSVRIRQQCAYGQGSRAGERTLTCSRAFFLRRQGARRPRIPESRWLMQLAPDRSWEGR